MKKSLLVLTVCLLLTLLCGSVTVLAETATVVNPLTEYATFEELCAAVPELVLSNAPQGATDVSYNTISGTPMVIQILFTLDGHNYCYRATSAATLDIALEQETYVNGLYMDFDHDVDMEDIREGDALPFQIPASFTFLFELEYMEKTPQVELQWYLPEVKTQYSLYSETAGLPNMTLLTVVETLQPTK